MSENEVLYSYTRKQAIDDGLLHEVGKLAKEAGFKIPLCITDGVHELCQPPEDDGCQSYEGRLWDVLILAVTKFKAALKISEEEASLVEFEVLFQVDDYKRIKERLWLVFNEFEGFTVMKPEEY